MKRHSRDAALECGALAPPSLQPGRRRRQAAALQGASRFALVFALLVFSGCSFFSRSQSRFFSIEQVPATTPVVNVRGLPVAIDGLELPPGTDRREVIVRKADHQVEVRSAEQWSAGLQQLVLHTLAFDLAGRLPEGMVILPGQARPAGAMRSVDVVFADLTAGPESQVVADAQVVIRVSGTPDVTRHERIVVPVPSLDSAYIATGMSSALAQLADRIAAALGS